MSGFPFATAILTVLFVVFAGATVGGAVIAAGARRIIRSVCGLAICCAGLAGLYYFLNSPFLALMEILIYIGAVCITIIFAVMLAEPDEAADTAAEDRGGLWGGAAVMLGLVVLGGVSWLALRGGWPAVNTVASGGGVDAIGRALLTTFSLAFEVISVVLLIAIVGALAIARAGRGHH